MEAVLAPGELVDVGGWIRKDVAGYDVKDLLIGSEGTLGVITAVRLRLLPAPEAALALMVFLPDRASGCEAIETVFAAGARPSVLDFLDATTLELAARSYPRAADGDGVPEGAGFALLVEVDGSEAEAQAQRAELLELFAADAVAVHEHSDAGALWRWRDGINPVVTAVRGAKVSGDVVLGVERLREGLEGFDAIAARNGLRPCAWGHGGEGNVHATVLVDPEDDRELDAAERVMNELFTLVTELNGSVAGEHGVGLLKGGWLARQWDAGAVEMHERIKAAFDPKGLLNPGKKLAR
jgi:FAD/FMN-containing dehydrogenase